MRELRRIDVGQQPPVIEHLTAVVMLTSAEENDDKSVFISDTYLHTIRTKLERE